MNKVLCMITMNAGDGIAGSTIKYCLMTYHSYFDKIVIIDGDLTDEAKIFYAGISNLCVVDSPWSDSYVDQYRAWSNHVDAGDWVLYLDCDEIPSQELAEYVSGDFGNEIEKAEAEGFNTLCLPCVLHLTDDGSNYYAVEKWPEKEYKGQWMKNILVKKDDTLDFRFFGSHVIPHHGSSEKAKYISLPYFHMKSLESFCYNDIWQAFLHPEGQNYSSIDAKLFKIFANFENTNTFKIATKEGTWSLSLKDFAWKNRRNTGNPVSRLAWVYWILEGHEMPIRDNFMKWENVKQFVLDKQKIDLMMSNKRKGKGISV